MAVSDTAEPDDLTATLRQLMLQQLFTFQKIRSDGNSGIKQVLYLFGGNNFFKVGKYDTLNPCRFNSGPTTARRLSKIKSTWETPDVETMLMVSCGMNQTVVQYIQSSMI